jgi:hypothetical protein
MDDRPFKKMQLSNRGFDLGIFIIRDQDSLLSTVRIEHLFGETVFGGFIAGPYEESLIGRRDLIDSKMLFGIVGNEPIDNTDRYFLGFLDNEFAVHYFL